MNNEVEITRKSLPLIGQAIAKRVSGVSFTVQDEFLTLSNGKKDLVLKAIIDDFIPGDEYVTFDLEDIDSEKENVIEFRADVINEEDVDFDDNDISVVKVLENYFG